MECGILRVKTGTNSQEETVNAFERLIFEQPRGMYREFQGLTTHFEPKDLSLYRKLLPDRFSMPDHPLVGFFAADYLRVYPWPMIPYREWAVLLKNEIQGETGWYALTLPVTSWVSYIGGRYLGFPKYITSEISFETKDDVWTVISIHRGITRLTLKFHRGIPRSLAPWEKLLMDDPSFFKGNTHQLVPPEKGPRAQKIIFKNEIEPSWSPLPGMITVQVDRSESWAGLVPDEAVFPGSYNYFRGGANLIAEQFS